MSTVGTLKTPKSAPHPRRPHKWQQVQAKMLRMVERGEPYSSLPKLARLFRCSAATIQRAIDFDPRLKAWQTKAWGKRGKRTGGPMAKLPAIRAALLRMVERGEPYPSLAKLARRFRCSRQTVQRAIDSDPRLMGWQMKGWEIRGKKTSASAANLPLIRAGLLRILERGEDYSSLLRLAKRFRCGRKMIQNAIDSDPRLMDWQFEGRRLGRRAAAKWPMIRPVLLRMVERGEHYSSRAKLARLFCCSEMTVQRAIDSDPTLRDWQIEGWKIRGKFGGVVAKWQPIREELLRMVKRGEPYPSLPKLARLFRCSEETIQRAIDSDPTLRDWQIDGWHLRGGKYRAAPRLQAATKELLPLQGSPSAHPQAAQLVKTDAVAAGRGEVADTPVTIREFMKLFCSPLSKNLRDSRAKSLLSAARRGRVELPKIEGVYKRGQSKKYRPTALVKRWPKYRDKLPNLPELSLS